MQTNIALLAKRAIGEALKGNWESAIQLNTQILEKNPDNLDAKLRLGRAFMQTKQFVKAKKMFKDALNQDPINHVARKNIDLICNKKLDLNSSIVNPSILIKEPGTTAETDLKLTGRGLTGDKFTSGEVLALKIKKRSVDVYKVKGVKEIIAGTITNLEIVNKLNRALDNKATLMASVIKCSNKQLEILLKSSLPVFKSEKQDIRPYIKKGSIDEPEIEVEEIELGS